MYVDSKRTVVPTMNEVVRASRMSHFTAALYQATRELWFTSAFQFHRAKGFDADTYFYQVVMYKLQSGGVKRLKLTDPETILACKHLYIPCTYKAIGIYLKEQPTGLA